MFMLETYMGNFVVKSYHMRINIEKQTFTESIFEASGHAFHVAHSAGSGGLSTDSLLAPVILSDLC